MKEVKRGDDVEGKHRMQHSKSNRKKSTTFLPGFYIADVRVDAPLSSAVLLPHARLHDRAVNVVHPQEGFNQASTLFNELLKHHYQD